MMINFKQWLEAAYGNRNGCRYWGDSGSGVIVFCNKTKRFLVNHRGQNVNEGGTFGLFGGGIFFNQIQWTKGAAELANTPIPMNHAKKELQEESGYNGSISMIELCVFKDERCDFYYWNYLGTVPEEFGVNPEANSAWEEGGKSGWITYEQLISLNPKHFGLKYVLDNAGDKIKRAVIQNNNMSIHKDHA